jgi:hypothetical protein
VVDQRAGAGKDRLVSFGHVCFLAVPWGRNMGDGAASPGGWVIVRTGR